MSKLSNDFSLFPKSEEWGTGDEALDVKLSLSLKSARENLSLETITAFYEMGTQLKTRTYNPSFVRVIDMVARALLHIYNPAESVDALMIKVRGHYGNFPRIEFDLNEKNKIIEELRKNGVSRYQQQIDFLLLKQEPTERNPFVKDLINRGANSLHTKIVFKEFKNFLDGSSPQNQHDAVALFHALKSPAKIIFIENFAELWYHQGQIFTLSHLS